MWSWNLLCNFRSCSALKITFAGVTPLMASNADFGLHPE